MNLLDKINEMEFLHMGETILCSRCRKKKNSFYSTSKGVQHCEECITQELEQQLKTAGKPDWTWERFIYALSPAATMKDRLMALVHFSHFQGAAKLPGLLVENLGFETNHPLAHLVRQKAFDACCAFKDRDRILRAIFSVKKYSTWQQRANIALAAYSMAPAMARVKSLVVRMAKDSSPNVRTQVADMIRGDENGWATAVFEELSRDRNPLVRETCLKKVGTSKGKVTTKGVKGAKGKTGSTSRAVTRKKVRPPNPMENIVRRNFDLPFPGKVYDRYLAHIPDLLDPGQYDPEEIGGLKQNSQESQVHLLGAALVNRVLFAAIVEKLPERAKEMLYICAGFDYGLDLYKAELKYIQARCEEFPKRIDEKTLYKNLSKDPDFFLFGFDTNLSYNRRREYTFEIRIKQGLLRYIRKLLPDPARPPLTRIQDVEKKTDYLFTDSQEIFKTLPVILSFISQDKIKYAKNSDKILVSSLKKIAEICKIKEFYADGDKDVRYLKTRLIADFFTSRSTWNLKELSDLPEFIKAGINDYFKFEEFKAHRCRDTFEYIKRQEKRFDTNTQEKRIRGNLKTILELIPDKDWVSVCSLAMIGEHATLNFCPFGDLYEINDIYIPMDPQNGYRDREAVGYAGLFSLDSTTLPFLRRMMFLFGAFGILDLAYSEPANAIYRECKKPYLSPFDGLKYVRITEFGRYVMGRTKKFTTEISVPSGEIVVDANKTLLSIQGEDPVKKMVLDAVGEQINRSSYRVDYNSFLKECATAADVNNKIAFFRANIAENPPPVWERFFEQLAARVNPIKSIPSVSVFKVNPDRELLSLLTGDTVLKKYVMRAESHHIVIEKTYIAKVKERLALFGYFVG